MLARFRSWLRATAGRRRMEEEMAAEMEAHVEERARDLVAGGLPRAEAERRARVEFGGVEALKEECREALGLSLLDECARNAQFAVRQLRRNASFTLTAVCTLALCIGANAIIFSLVDTLLIRPLPYPDPDRLGQVVIHVRGPQGEGLEISQDGATFEVLRGQASSLEIAAEGTASGVNLAAGRHVEFVQQHRVSAGFFSVLGVAPLLGREFTGEEDRPGGPPVVVLSYSLWQRVFQGDSSALGNGMILRGEPYTVIGVMPRDFQSPVPADVWTPLRPGRTGEGAGSNYIVVGRLRPGVSWAQAEANLQALSRAVTAELRRPADITLRLGLLPLQQASTMGVREILFVLWGAVGMVLLIGCANIAGLLLARGARRTREMATRMALGGSRGALVRQLLTESVVLAVMGGALGIAAAYAGLDALAPHFQSGLGISETIRIDWRVLAVSAALTFLTALLFGLFPALHASRTDIRAALVEGGGHGIIGARRHWPRRLLLVFEVALGVILLVVATQFTRTFLRLANLSPGFDSESVYTASLSLQDARYKEAAKVSALFDDTLRRIRALPGVTDAAVALSLPYQRPLNMGFRVLDGLNAGGEWRTTNFTYTTAGYFDTLRIPLLRGRLLRESDGASAPPVAVVNLAFARRYLPGQEPVGTHFEAGGRAIEIVGVVGDTPQRPGWGDYGPLEAIPGVFVPAAQTTDGFLQLVHTWFSPHWMVRTAGPGEGLVAGMQDALAASDPMLPFSGFSNMKEVRENALSRHRFEAMLVNGFAVLALLLSAIGIGGLISSSVAERWREMGVRIALGATVTQSIRAVAAPGVVLTIAGLGFGSVLAYPALLAIEKLVWGIQPSDPANFAVAGLVLVLVAVGSSFAPAVRLRRLNVADTLREG